MLPLLATVFVFSLLGSTHCVGMCGPFLFLATGGQPKWEALRLSTFYNIGRLVVYVVLGATAGAVGLLFDTGGHAAGIQKAATMFAGVSMILVGLIVLVRHFGVRIPEFSFGRIVHNKLLAIFKSTASLPASQRALTVGLLTSLMPCGWLYAFAIAASGTGHPLWGALTMSVFWAGTVPVMTGLSLSFSLLNGKLRAHIPLIMSLSIIAVGFFTVFARTPDGIGQNAARLDNPEQAMDFVKTLDQEQLPCCKEKEE